MNKKLLARGRRCNRNVRRGISLALIGFMLPVVILLCAFAVNVAQMQLVRTELQVATDASARAAGKVFTETGDLNEALAAANLLGEENLVASEPLQFSLDDIKSGISIRPNLDNPYSFSEAPGNHNAIRLEGRRTEDALSGSVGFLFPLFASREFEPLTVAISTQVDLDIALVLDRSGSMCFADDEPANYPPNPASAPPGWSFGDPAPPDARWRGAVDAAQAFLNALAASPQQELVSLTTYSNNGTSDIGLTADYASIMAGLDGYTQSFPGGSTNIAEGISVGTAQLNDSPLARPFAAKVIVVMTDGNFNAGGHPKYAAKAAADGGTMVFTVTFSNEAGTTAMIETANEGGGKHFHATTDQDLVAVFEEIARSLPTLITK